MSGPFESDPSPADRPSQPAPAQPTEQGTQRADANNIDRAALEQALQETLTAASSGAPLDPEETAAIREVARRHTHSEVTLETAADLIQAILSTHFRPLQLSSAFWQTVARDIARTLLDDPTAEARLNTLWQRLRKEVP